jgi:hypothetical protein
VGWRLLPLLLVAAAAGCGGSGSPPRTSATATHAQSATRTSAAQTCAARAKARALKKLDADLAALRRAAAHPGKDTLAGNAAVNRATDRFLTDVNTAPIDNLARNRMIDHAAAALLGACEQCFQALEAERPIPAIEQGDRGTCAKP